MSKVTMTAIAQAVGVGVAPVDRVLNLRAPVRSVTEQKVLAAARQLGYRLSQVHNLLPGQPVAAHLRFGFILLPARYSFYQQLGEALQQRARVHQSPGSEAEFCWHDIHEVEAVARSLRQLAQCSDVIGLVALDHPLIRHAIQDVSRLGACGSTRCCQISRPVSTPVLSALITRKRDVPPDGWRNICCVSRDASGCPAWRPPLHLSGELRDQLSLLSARVGRQPEGAGTVKNP